MCDFLPVARLSSGATKETRPELMDTKTKTRDFIVDFLARELVGPSDEEEVLDAGNPPPRRRYAAGILFPGSAQVASHEETSEDEKVDSGATNVNDLGDAEADGVEYGVKSEQSKDDTNEAPDTEGEVTLTDQFLPSAMGITALVEIPPDSLVVNVSAGIYGKEKIQGSEVWKRQPVRRSINIGRDELVGGRTRVLQKTVLEEDRTPVLVIHITSRPHQGKGERRLITFTLVNRRIGDSHVPANEDCFFQCGFRVSAPGGEACFLGYPEYSSDREDHEDMSLRLLYSHKHTFAVGHGCAPEWNESDGGRATVIRTAVLPRYEISPVLPKEIEGLDLLMRDLAFGEPELGQSLCLGLADEYGNWVEEKEKEIDGSDMSVRMKETALRNMEQCRECLRRVREGIEFLDQDPDVALAFRLMNRAMLMQHAHYEIFSNRPREWKENDGRLALEGSFIRPRYDESNRAWRPFQLAFILMNLKAVADPDCDERSIVDVIWFPTGGGKTEAYLGLSACVMFLRRLRDPSDAGTAILMRYTLRLLTTQQFQRAASLLCACEFIRREKMGLLGEGRFSIGLWVGGEVTPNTEKDAVKALNDLERGQGANKFIMLGCPWCGAEMGPKRVGSYTRCKGYRKQDRPSRVRFICEDEDCDFNHSRGGLPLAVTDEQIYGEPPTLLIGTVDKFAMLPFRPKARGLFGIGTPYSPPELIIQDELHLISGPLGSMVGHYETAVNALCVRGDGEVSAVPKIIASTATISRAQSQVKGLYGRETFLFPPQALKAGDSFFAEQRGDKAGRLYIGVFANAVSSHVISQTRTMTALLQAPKLLPSGSKREADPYWTMVGYFNTLRDLGRAVTLVRSEIAEFLKTMWRRLGSDSEKRRYIGKDLELTSRIPSSEIPGILKQLFFEYGHPEAADICFATSMIQVGIDIQRLGLMTIVGQPKTTSEYIQASSRIGREHPGIVVTIYNPFRPRDRSYYEHFRSYHQSIYMHVEPASVTPFALPVRERALHALVITLSRFLDEEMLNEPKEPSDSLVRRIKKIVRDRVVSADPDEWGETEEEIDRIIENWKNYQPSRYGDFSTSQQTPLMYPAGGQRDGLWDEEVPYATLTSMRHVDGNCSARQLRRKYKPW